MDQITIIKIDQLCNMLLEIEDAARGIRGRLQAYKVSELDVKEWMLIGRYAGLLDKNVEKFLPAMNAFVFETDLTNGEKKI